MMVIGHGVDFLGSADVEELVQVEHEHTGGLESLGLVEPVELAEVVDQVEHLAALGRVEPLADCVFPPWSDS